MVSASTNKKGRFLPPDFDIAHDLCFTIHDAMVQIIKSGTNAGIFTPIVDVANAQEVDSLDKADDVITWLKDEGRLNERAQFLKTGTLPYILSDMMHCVFEALETSRKGKLNISFMLIRKPIQESLYVLESIILSELDFAQNLADAPLSLRPSQCGGVEGDKGHIKRIEQVLAIINESSRFDAEYIARLRYDKYNDDSFDRVCNLAMHLFTDRKPIRTENLNINFIFSGWDEKVTQWHYLYSRLPYLLFYMYQIIEHILSGIAPTPQEYLDDIQRKISAQIILWWETVDEHYICEQLTTFVQKTESWLNEHCQLSGYQQPTSWKDLLRMAKCGAYPKENVLSLRKRHKGYRAQAALNKKMRN